MGRIRRSAQAREDLIEIAIMVAREDLAAAERLLDRLEKASKLLAETPQLGPARDDIRPGLRYLVVGAYLILYRLVGDGIEIVRVVHGRRDLPGLF